VRQPNPDLQLVLPVEIAGFKGRSDRVRQRCVVPNSARNLPFHRLFVGCSPERHVHVRLGHDDPRCQLCAVQIVGTDVGICNELNLEHREIDLRRGVVKSSHEDAKRKRLIASDNRGIGKPCIDLENRGLFIWVWY
jgi:hypothetical protein